MTRQERLGATRTQAPRGLLDIMLHVTAYHEAGHITCAEALGLRVKYAWMDLRGRRVDGQVHSAHFEHEQPEWAKGELSPDDVLGNPERERHIYSRLIVATAGLVSEEAWCAGMGIEHPPDLVSDQDQMQALGLKLCAVPDGQGSWTVNPELARRIILSSSAEAERILEPRWTAVGYLAGELAHRGDLSGDEVRAILAQHGGLVPAAAPQWPLPPAQAPAVSA
jgi:hypothetical protein